MPKKRLIICCDGTWNWPDQKGNPTNVVKMVRAIRPADDLGVPQIVFYDTGVGTGNLLDRIAGGLFGVGLADNVKQTYGFVVDNYQPGDELFLFGFSRGAHTVRSLGGLIGLIGLIPKQHMDEFPQAWAYYRTPPKERTETQRREFLGTLPGGCAATEDPNRFHRRLGHGRHHGHSDGTAAHDRPAPVPLP